MFSVLKSLSKANNTNNSSEISGVISLLCLQSFNEIPGVISLLCSQSFDQNHMFLFVPIQIL